MYDFELAESSFAVYTVELQKDISFLLIYWYCCIHRPISNEKYQHRNAKNMFGSLETTYFSTILVKNILKTKQILKKTSNVQKYNVIISELLKVFIVLNLNL